MLVGSGWRRRRRWLGQSGDVDRLVQLVPEVAAEPHDDSRRVVGDAHVPVHDGEVVEEAAGALAERQVPGALRHPRTPPVGQHGEELGEVLRVRAIVGVVSRSRAGEVV